MSDYLYVLFGTDAREYCSNVYRISLKTLESNKLFDSLEIIDRATFIEMERLDQEYPNDFLDGRYRQEVVHYENKLYALGGGKRDGDSCPLDLVS